MLYARFFAKLCGRDLIPVRGKRLAAKWWLTSLGLVVILGLAGSRTLEAAEFIRGDFNSDGEVSLADSYAALTFIFIGAVSECPNAGDFDDDGRLDITDALMSIVHVVMSGEPPASPFPNVGPDPTENEGSNLFCDSYGNGSPLDDASAHMSLRSATVAGGDERIAVIPIVLSNSTSLGGYRGRIEDPSGIIVAVDDPEEVVNEVAGTFFFKGANLSERGIDFGLLATIFPPGTPIRAGQDVTVLGIPVCLAGNASR